VILGASFDTVEENAAFAEKFSFPFQLLCDTSREIGRAYGAERDATRGPKRISYLIGPDGVIVKAYDTINTAEHPAEVLAELTRART
jgi:peroxiredoxin Q/BCP